MTDQELQILQELMFQQDPMAAAANDWGQGADYLTSPKKPVAFARQGDMHQIYRNLFGMTGIDMNELVPNLYPEVQQPEDTQPYVSDSASLYAGNQAYDAVKELVDSGALSFEEAVSRAAADPGLAQFLPKDDKGKPNLEAFRTGAATYVTEGQKAGRSQGEAAAKQAAYDDYVRMRTGEDFVAPRAGRDELLARTAPQRQLKNQLPSVPTSRGTVPRVPVSQGLPSDGNYNDFWKEYGAVPSPRPASQPTTQPSTKKGSSKTPQLMNQVAKRMQPKVDAENQRRTRAAEGARAELASYDAARAKLASRQVQSKQQENQQRIIAFYNQLMRQGG